MQPLVANLLWTGNARCARDLTALAGAGIEAVVDVAGEEEPAVLARSVIYSRVPLIDGADNETWALKLAIQTVSELIQSRVPTLVACSAGMSRSPSIAVAALAVASGVNPDDELKRLAETCMFSVSPALWQHVARTCLDLS